MFVECIEVYFAGGDGFLTDTNISPANPATTKFSANVYFVILLL